MTDYEKRERKANRNRGTRWVLEQLRDIPAAFEAARIVGRWVWLEFDAKPESSVRSAIGLLGFHWNRKREAWQHPCGFFMHHSPGDPREKYGVVRADEVLAEAGKAGVA
jgi:hypothetical protein